MRKLSFLILAAAFSAVGAQSKNAGTQNRELLPEEQVQQVLSRLTFGARPGDAEKVRAMGIDQWIEAQLRPETIDDPFGQKVASTYSIYRMPTPDIVRDYNALQQLQQKVARAAGQGAGAGEGPRASLDHAAHARIRDQLVTLGRMVRRIR